MWNETFSKKGSTNKPLSNAQCEAARAIFGDTDEVVAACGETKDLAAKVTDAVLASDAIMRQIAAIETGMKSLQAGIAELKKFRREFETEKKMTQSRFHQALYGGDWPTAAGRTGETSNANEPGDFVSAAARHAARSLEPRRNALRSQSLNQQD